MTLIDKLQISVRPCFQEIYEQIDKNNDGTIEFEEFVTVLDHPKVNLSRYILNLLWMQC